MSPGLVVDRDAASAVDAEREIDPAAGAVGRDGELGAVEADVHALELR